MRASSGLAGGRWPRFLDVSRQRRARRRISCPLRAHHGGHGGSTIGCGGQAKKPLSRSFTLPAPVTRPPDLSLQAGAALGATCPHFAATLENRAENIPARKAAYSGQGRSTDRRRNRWSMGTSGPHGQRATTPVKRSGRTTDQKVGGSNPSERARQVQVRGPFCCGEMGTLLRGDGHGASCGHRPAPPHRGQLRRHHPAACGSHCWSRPAPGPDRRGLGPALRLPAARRAPVLGVGSLAPVRALRAHTAQGPRHAERKGLVQRNVANLASPPSAKAAKAPRPRRGPSSNCRRSSTPSPTTSTSPCSAPPHDRHAPGRASRAGVG